MFFYDQTRIHTFQPTFLHQDFVYDQVLQNILLQTSHATDSDFENFNHLPSSVDQILSVLGTLENVRSNIRNSFPLNDPTNNIHKG